MTAPSRQLARIPDSIDDITAGAVPLASLIAWQSLVDTARVGPGQRALIHAAGGGVGHLAVQIAKSRGAYVIGTDGTDKQDFLRSIGVDEPIDHETTDVFCAIGDVDIVLDLIGGEIGRRSLSLLRSGGLLVCVPADNADDVLNEADRTGVRATGILVEPDGRALEQIGGLMANRQLRVQVDTVLPLDAAARAHELSESGGVKGKIVLAVARR